MAIWKRVRFGQQIFENLPLFLDNVTTTTLLMWNVQMEMYLSEQYFIEAWI